MADQELKLVGKIKDAHGIRGEVFIIFFAKDYSWIDDIDEIYIESKTYKILNMTQHKDGLKVKLENVTDRNVAESLIGQQVYISADIFESEDGESLYLSEIENFKVIDETAGELGHIIGFSSNTAQDLLVVKSATGNKEYEIPFVDAFVIEIDHDKQIIKMNLPEGLLEINDSE